MSEKIIKEGGYQPTKDPPPRPPASVIKPASATPPQPADDGGDPAQPAPPGDDQAD